ERLNARTVERERAREHAEQAAATNKLLLEAERAARAEADAAVRLRDEFLSVAAHELKTPLTGLQIAVQLEMRRARRGDVNAESLVERFSRVDRQLQRLGRLIGQLLDVTRLQAGRLTLERAPADLRALVEDAVSQARARSSHDAITIVEI